MTDQKDTVAHLEIIARCDPDYDGPLNQHVCMIAASLIRSLVGRVEGLQTNLYHAVESRRIQEAHREAAETALAAEKRAREEAAAIAKDLADRGYSGDAIAAALRSRT